MKIQDIIRNIIADNPDFYYAYFDDPFFIMNAEDDNKRTAAMALSVLMSLEREPDGSIMLVTNDNREKGLQRLSDIEKELIVRGFDKGHKDTDFFLTDMADMDDFDNRTRDRLFSLVIIEDADSYGTGYEAENSRKINAIRGLRTDRILVTANEDYDPGYEEPEDKVPGQMERGKHGDVLYNPAYSEYNGFILALMDALGLEEDDVFRNSLKDSEYGIYCTANQLFSLGNVYGSPENGSDEKKKETRELIILMQNINLAREGRYLLSNYSHYDCLDITDRNRLMECLACISFSGDDMKRVTANYEKYAGM